MGGRTPYKPSHRMQVQTGDLELEPPKDSYDNISKTQLRDRNHSEYSIRTFEKEYLK